MVPRTLICCEDGRSQRFLDNPPGRWAAVSSESKRQGRAVIALSTYGALRNSRSDEPLKGGQGARRIGCGYEQGRRLGPGICSSGRTCCILGRMAGATRM